MFRNALLVLAIAGSVCAAPLRAQETPRLSKDAAIRKVLTASHAIELALQVMDKSLDMARQQHPEVPVAYWGQAQAKIHARSGKLMDLMVPIYDKYFSQEEIEALIVFYESPTGQKLVATQEPLARDSMAAGEKWGREIGEEIAREIDAERPKKPAPQPAPKPAAKPGKKKTR